MRLVVMMDPFPLVVAWLLIDSGSVPAVRQAAREAAGVTGCPVPPVGFWRVFGGSSDTLTQAPTA